MSRYSPAQGYRGEEKAKLLLSYHFSSVSKSIDGANYDFECKNIKRHPSNTPEHEKSLEYISFIFEVKSTKKDNWRVSTKNIISYLNNKNKMPAFLILLNPSDGDFIAYYINVKDLIFIPEFTKIISSQKYLSIKKTNPFLREYKTPKDFHRILLITANHTRSSFIAETMKSKNEILFPFDWETFFKKIDRIQYYEVPILIAEKIQKLSILQIKYMLNDTLVKGHSNDEIKKALVTLAALDKKNTDANGLLDDFLSRINHKNKVSDAPKFIANTVGFWRAAAFQFEEEAISYFGRLINERDKFENIMFSSAVLSALTFSKNDRTQEHSIRLLNKIKLKLKKYDHIYKVKREILRGEIESGIKKDHSDLNQLIKFGIESNDEIQYLSEYGWTSGIMNNLERKIHTPTIRDINLSSTYKIMWRLVDLYGKDI